MVRHRAGAGQAEPGAPRDARELMRPERRVGGHHRDAAPGRVAIEARRAELAAHGHAVDPELGAVAVVREHEHADRVPPPVTRLELPMPPFQPKQTIPVPAPTAPWVTASDAAASARARCTSPGSTCGARGSFSQLSSHSPTTGITTASTPIRGSTAIAAATAPSYTRPTDIVAVRYTGVSITPHSAIWSEPGELAGAVQHGHARGNRLGPQALDRSGQHRGHARAANRGVTDGNALHVRDRGRRARLQLADAQAVLAQASSRRPWRDSTN